MPTGQNRFTQQIPQKKLISDYMREIDALNRAMKLDNFSEIMANVENYTQTLQLAADNDPIKHLSRASKGKFILSVAEMTPYSRSLFYSAHLAACCNLLREKTLLQSEFVADTFAALALKNISQPIQMDAIQQIYNLLHTMDGMRTMQLLRLAGLVTRPSHEMLQLALGVGSALKDIHYLHALPFLERQQTIHGEALNFNIVNFNVGHIIISDSDPRYQHHFSLFSEQDTPPVLAFNLDSEKTFAELLKRDIQKRNLITLIRVDHHMIPAPKDFIQQLLPFIDDDCDFVISIGSGDTIDEYRGRTKLIKALFELLKKAKLCPVLFKLHGNGPLQKQWASLRLGSASASTYQILHCKLKRSELEKHFNKQ